MAVSGEAVEYAKKCFADGFSDSEVSKALADAGWPEGEVKEAISAAKGVSVGGSSEGDGGQQASLAESFKSLSWAGDSALAVGIAAVLVWVYAFVACDHCLKVEGFVGLAILVVEVLLLVGVCWGLIYAVKKFVLK